MTSHMIDLTWLGQFHIITYPKADLVICHLTYLTFQIILLDQPFGLTFESTYAINLLIELVAPQAYGTLLFPTNVCT